MRRGGRLVPRAAAHRSRRRRGPPLPAGPGPRRRRRAPYRIGWAPDDWDRSSKALQLPDKVAAGRRARLRLNKRDRMQDFFRGASCSRSSTPQGDPVAFGGRKLPGDDGPKYRNTPETQLYAKSKVLYGLNWAKEEVGPGRRGHRLRGLHRRDRFRPGRAPAGRRHLRHGAHRGPRPAAQAVRPAGGAGLRPRRGRAGGRRPVLRVGAPATRSTSRWPTCRRAWTRPTSPVAIPSVCARRSTAPPRSSGSASSGSSPARSCPRPRVGRGPPRRRWPPSPSIRASSSATST